MTTAPGDGLLLEPANAALNRCRHALVGIGVLENYDAASLQEARPGRVVDDGQDGLEFRCQRCAHGSFQQGTAVENDSLLGPAKAAGGAGGEDERGWPCGTYRAHWAWR